MKFLAVFLIISSVMAVLNAGASNEEKMAAMKKIVMDCAAKENASQADLEELFAKKPATSPTGKCHRACMHETFGTMKDNKFNPDGFMAMIKMSTDGDEAKMKIAQEVVKDCADKMDADRCEAGAKICTCLAGSTKARGLEM
ncbi:general odorant-binding protein 28a-like [Sitodiplosis mosellana]|uniref:general odorant-binding protein 28a-like n=1 Tax=Sitodiplosis mosellana TaxID=263140 RepID=UPI00244422DC|nr:general odorant-binding protein 28a-like [Sitodiplosis mosellana]